MEKRRDLPDRTCRAADGRRATRPRRARGAVLVTGMIILAVMIIVGTSYLRTTALEERMVGNLKEQNDAFQAAEAGLQGALSYVASLRTPPEVHSSGGPIWPGCQVTDPDNATCSPDGSDPCCFLRTVLASWKSGNPTAGVTIQDLGGDKLSTISDTTQPHIVIESRYPPPLDFEDAARGRGYHYYTATAVGIGPGGLSRSILQSTITRLYP